MYPKLKPKPLALVVLLFLSFLGFATTSFASNVSISRYLSVPVKPKFQQIHLLQQQMQIKFPQNVLTIKQAVRFLLQFSGYRLADDKVMDQSSLNMLDQSLPEIDRAFGPVTLEQALSTLSGDTFYLLVDPVNRKVGFQLKSAFHLMS